MKKVMFVILFVYLGLTSYAQNDTTAAKQFAERLNKLRKERGQKELVVIYKTSTKKADRPFRPYVGSMKKIIDKKFYLIENEKTLHDSIRYVLQHTGVYDYSFKFCSFDTVSVPTNEFVSQCNNLNLFNDTTYNHVVVWAAKGKVYGLFIMKCLTTYYGWITISAPSDLCTLWGETEHTNIDFKDYNMCIDEYNIQKYPPKYQGKLEVKGKVFSHIIENDVKSIVFTNKNGQIIMFFTLKN